MPTDIIHNPILKIQLNSLDSPKKERKNKKKRFQVKFARCFELLRKRIKLMKCVQLI